MKEITLTNSNKKAQVDDEDFEFINSFEWHLSNDGFAKTVFDNGREIEMGSLVMWKASLPNN